MKTLEDKVRMQSGVAKPDHNVITSSGVRERCWAEKRTYSGSLFAQFDNCGKPARQGYLTCRWHADREDDAQTLKASLS